MAVIIHLNCKSNRTKSSTGSASNTTFQVTINYNLFDYDIHIKNYIFFLHLKGTNLVLGILFKHDGF